MSGASFERVASVPESWRTVASDAYRVGQALIADGKRARIKVEADEDSLTLRQLRFIHGPVLDQISEQVRVNGVLFTKEVWKRHLKDLFIPDAFDMVFAPFVRDAKTGEWRPSKRKVPRKREKSLKDLTGRARSDFIDQVLAHAATDWGVDFVFIFDDREAVRYHAPRRAVARKAEEVAA